MKKPLLNQFERDISKTDTFAGAGFRLELARAKMNRAILKENAIFKTARFIEKTIHYILS